MAQQFGIILMIDVEGALKDNTLEGYTYLYDNMKLLGSEGQGTGKLVTAVHGLHYFDGSQAAVIEMNWLPYGISSIPPLPVSEKSDSLDAIEELTNKLENIDKGDIEKELRAILRRVGKSSKIHSKNGNSRKIKNGSHLSLRLDDDEGPDKDDYVSHLMPIITNITGEAVDKKVMYPSLLGSPDVVTDGWYWFASVDTSKTGTFAYTMHVQMYKPVKDENNHIDWTPVDMTCEAYIHVTDKAKINGFTKAGIDYLDIPA